VLYLPSGFLPLPHDVGGGAQPFWPTPQELQDGLGLRNNSNSSKGGIRALSTWVLRGGRFLVGIIAITSTLVVLSGCATHEDANKGLRPGAGVAEYSEITKEAQKAVGAAVNSLDKVSTHTNECPPELRQELARDVQRLQVDSLRIRARAQAIQTRGDAYFADWSETLKQIQNPGIREAAERNHPQLEQSFSRIKSASQQAGTAFKPFLSGLRQLHINLDNNPSAAASESGTELLKATHGHGQEVLKQLGVITNQLHEITRMLKPAN